MKTQLRKALRAKRRALPPALHAEHSGRAAAAITRLRRFKSGARVAIYLSFDGETDTASLLAAARRRRVRIFVPVVTDLRHRRIRFYPLSKQTRRGAYGIAIPHHTSKPIAARWLSLIVVPLVGIDATGRRLGMGGGFYDRAFEFRRRRNDWRGPLLVGLAFDCQRVESVEADSWDLGLDGLATESGMNFF